MVVVTEAVVVVPDAVVVVPEAVVVVPEAVVVVPEAVVVVPEGVVVVPETVVVTESVDGVVAGAAVALPSVAPVVIAPIDESGPVVSGAGVAPIDASEESGPVVPGAAVVASQAASSGMLRSLHFQTRSLIRVTYVLVEHRGCSNTSIMDMRRPIFEPFSGPPHGTLNVLPPHSILCLLFVDVIVVRQVLVRHGQWNCPACRGGITSVIGASAVVGASAAVGASSVAGAVSDAGAATVVVSFVLFCLCSFKVPAPATALQVTLLVTSVRLP